MWRRQATKLDIMGTATTTLDDMNIDGYHGYGAYDFGDPEAKARPYILGGLGATNYGGVATRGSTARRPTRGRDPVLHDVGRGPER